MHKCEGGDEPGEDGLGDEASASGIENQRRARWYSEPSVTILALIVVLTAETLSFDIDRSLGLAEGATLKG